MSDYSCGGRALIEARVTIPEQGAIRAEVEVDGETAISGEVDLVLTGGVAYRCTVMAGGVSDTRVLAVLTSGKGTLGDVVPGQHFYQSAPRTIIQSGLNGELLNPVMPSIADQPIARWMRIEQPGDAALAQLAAYLGLGWWFDPDGQIRLGQIEYPEVTLSGLDVLPLDQPQRKRFDFGNDETLMQPRTSVGTAYGTYRITEVRYWLSQGRWRGTAYYV